MTELLRKAWLGWTDYIDYGKMAALLAAALLFMWFGKKKVVHKPLLLYTTVITVCCVLPPTAAVLMAYQTIFYDYQWIWSLVPVTAVTAWGAVLFLTEIWPDFKPALWRKGLPGAALVAAVAVLCGPLGSSGLDKDRLPEKKMYAYSVLETVKETYPGERLCLWAPREIMEYAREADPAILLPYGRNMWNIALSGYAYDSYDERMTAMYQWMEGLQGADFSEAAASDPAASESCVGYALDTGVTCILLPKDTEPETVRKLEKTLNVEARKLEDYWIFYGWTD